MTTSAMPDPLRHNEIVLVVGTRPESIKIAPIAIEAQKAGLPVQIWSTGQQADLVEQALIQFDLKPDVDINVMSARQGLNDIWSRVIERLSCRLEGLEPPRVIVQGDTATAAAAAVASRNLGIPVAHVEAGLRTHDVDSPFPEELNRRIIGAIADVHFAPTERAARNLVAEGISKEAIIVCGNTSIDAALITLSQTVSGSTPISFELGRDKLILVTLHRRENHGIALSNQLVAIAEVARRAEEALIVVPVHPNPVVRDAANLVLGGSSENVLLIEPLDYPDLLNTLARTDVLITDSGGLQEEASIFRIPTLICRTTTERPEAIDAGYARLVADDSTAIRDLALTCLHGNPPIGEARCGVHRQPNRDTPYGDGSAASIIVSHLATQ